MIWLVVLLSGGSHADQAVAPPHTTIQAVEVVGTTLRVSLADGRALQGTELVGARLSLVLPGHSGASQIRLDRIIGDPEDPAHEILLYDIKVLDDAGRQPEDLCDRDPSGHQWSFPLQGHWDVNGTRVSSAGFTLTCANGAQGKCVRFGYKPWKRLADGTSLAAYHKACVRMVRADYCGNEGTTRDGMLIDYFDRLGIAEPARQDEAAGLTFEAAWNEAGAVCVAHTRVQEKITPAQLVDRCPRLRGRVGAICTEASARAGQFGTALLFNRSRQ
jgi:hypothetical protein